MYVIWNDQCQSVEAGEDGGGWPSYQAASAACGGAEMPAFVGPHGLVFGALACAKAEAAAQAVAARAAVDSARRSAVMASITAQAPAAAQAKPDRAITLANLLASNTAALSACKRTDKAEIARLSGNIARLRAELGEPA